MSNEEFERFWKNQMAAIGKSAKQENQ